MSVDIEKAKKIVLEMAGQKYISFGKGTVVLDDDFTIEQLEAIIIIMKGTEK